MLRETVAAGVGLNLLDFGHDPIERAGHQLVHRLGLMALDEIGMVAVAAEQGLQFLVADPGQDGGPGDLVAVQVQDRQHDAVGRRVEKLVRMPTGGQGPRFGLAVADHASREKIGVIEHRAVGVRKGVAQFAPFVDRAGRFGGRVAGNPARKGKLREQPLHPRFVLRNVRVNLAVGSFQIGVGDDPRGAVARPGDVDRVEIMLFDGAVEMNVDEVQSGRGSPVPQQPRLDVFVPQGLLQERVVEEIDLTDGQIVSRPPIGVDFAEPFRGKWLSHDTVSSG
jgi:hypothetical protein